MSYLLKVTPVSVSIHREDENPIFGERAVHVSICDEAAGPFLMIHSDASEVRIEMEELELVLVEARKLIKSYPKVEKP